MEFTKKQVWGDAFASLGRQWWRILVIYLTLFVAFVIFSVGVVSAVASSVPKLPFSHAPVATTLHKVHTHVHQAMQEGAAQAMAAQKKWQMHFCSVKSLIHMRDKGVPAGSLVMMGCSDADLSAAGFNPLDVSFSIKEMGWMDRIVGKAMIFFFMHQHFPTWAFVLLGVMFFVLFMSIGSYWCLHVILMDLKGQHVDLWLSLRAVCACLHHVMLYILLSFALIALGIICLVIPGVVVMVYLAPGFAFVLLERQNAIDAMKSSVALVRGQWWFTLGAMWIPALFVNVLVWVLHGLGSALGIAAFVGVLSGIIHIIYYFYIAALCPCVYQALCARKDRSANA